MRKFSVNRKKKEIEPSDAQIKRHKDFARLHHSYETLTKRSKIPIYRNTKLYVLVVLIAVILFLIFFEDKF